MNNVDDGSVILTIFLEEIMDCFACGGDICSFKVTLSVPRIVNTPFGYEIALALSGKHF